MLWLMTQPRIPVAAPVDRRGGDRQRDGGDALGLDQLPRRVHRAVRARVRRPLRNGPRDRGGERDGVAPPRPRGRGGRAGRRGDHSEPHLRGHRQRRPLLRRHARVRRLRARDVAARSRGPRGAHHPADARHHARAPLRAPVRHGPDPRRGQAPRAGRARRRRGGARRRVSGPARRLPRRHRLLLLLRQQDHHHRRGRHVRHQ